MPFDPTTSDLAGLPTATLQQWLLDAQTALHQLSIGAKAETVTYTQASGSKAVTYTRANMAQLRAHIAALKIQLGIVQSGRRPMRPTFR